MENHVNPLRFPVEHVFEFNQMKWIPANNRKVTSYPLLPNTPSPYHFDSLNEFMDEK